MADEAKWYVVHTYSGYENKVAKDLLTKVENQGLQDSILSIRIPTEMVTEEKDGQEIQVEHKLFPGYVLVKMVMNNDTWYVVRNTRGCTGFVGPESKPVALSPAEVKKFGVDEQGDAAGLDEASVSVVVNSGVTVEPDFVPGDNVEIVDGPLEGFIALVESVNVEQDLVKVKVSMFGRETPAELKIKQVKPL